MQGRVAAGRLVAGKVANATISVYRVNAQTRALMQEELASIWRTTSTTVLFITHDIDEAVTLGTRIGVMRAGPRSDVKGVLDVELNGARDRTDDVFLRYYKQVHEMIRDEVAKSMARRS